MLGREEAPFILIVDSDPGVRWSLERGLTLSGFHVRVADSPRSALSLSKDNAIRAIFFEIIPEAGLTVELLSEVLAASDSAAIICSSVDASPDNVTDCIVRGCTKFLQRPFNLSEVRSELGRAISASAKVNVAHEVNSLIIGTSEAARELRATVQKVAQSKLNCLIRGSSGVGKDVVAREIHRLSDRRAAPFVKVNCTALPESLLESELFGYEKGAFTGADSAKPGRFSLADRGIIFLDEICDMPISIQAKLLQVTEHKQFMTVGGRTPVNVDVQLITASNAPFEQRIQKRLFRSDLFYRINEVCITVPPLIDRKVDIPVLANHFIQKHLAGETGKVPKLSTKEIETLSAWDWPGNIRELESTIKRWLFLGTLQINPSQHLNEITIAPKKELARKAAEPGLDDIIKTLEECQWNRTKAAKNLGMNYQKLRLRINQYNIVQ